MQVGRNAPEYTYSPSGWGSSCAGGRLARVRSVKIAGHSYERLHVTGH
jgi:hypothetical protein